jgi:hypothetical protein
LPGVSENAPFHGALHEWGQGGGHAPGARGPRLVPTESARARPAAPRLPPSGEVLGISQLSLFSAAQRLAAPWEAVDLRFAPKAGRIDSEVAFNPGARFACPHCGAEHQPVHGTPWSGSGGT